MKKINDIKVEAYTDGSYINDSKCGYGIYYANDILPNVSRKYKGMPTNNRAELHAIYVALIQILKNIKASQITIYTDSNYCIQSITWAKKWSKNKWMTSTNTPVKNKDIIQPIYEIVEKNKNIIKFVHVRSHTNNKDIQSINNDKADYLAKLGANK